MRVCLVTPAQPTTNPRLVKEADALAAAGHDVHVIAAHWIEWATAADAPLLATRAWRLTFIDSRREVNPSLYHRSRTRHWIARRFARPGAGDRMIAAALSRVGPELVDAALRVHADLYIAHNLAALPAACVAARARGVPFAFDAEDFHSGQLSPTREARTRTFTERVEQRYLPSCAYVTAAAPGIAETYRDLCGIPLPTTILNVFPLRDRPAQFRPADPNAPLRLYWFSQTIGGDRGLQDAVRAMGSLKNYPIELHLRGRWDDGFEGELRQLAASLGLAPDRIVGHAPAAADEMVRLAAACDIGLALEQPVPLNRDIALTNKIFTYALAGCAILATRTRGQERLLPELGAAAAGCAPGQPESIAAALRRWLDDPAALAAARAHAWQLGETRFNWDVEQKTFLDIVARGCRAAGSRVAADADVSCMVSA
jgi:glycosyltransferase involved in cell wall biosynthesis